MDIKIPEVGESIHEALIAEWLKDDGAAVRRDEVICELETDKINVEITAEVSGLLHIKAQAGETLPVGTLIATIEEAEVADEAPSPDQAEAETKAEAKAAAADKEPAASPESKPAAAVSREEAAPADQKGSEPLINPAAARLAREKGIDPGSISGRGRQGRVLVEDVMAAEQPAQPKSTGRETTPAEPAEAQPAAGDERPVTRQPMSPLRQKIAQRLLEARQQTAMLTTFNEADLSRVLNLRKKQQEQFKQRHGIKLGLMSFFVKSCIEALKEYPAVNGRIDGNDIVYHNYYDIGIAVGTERGLVVPVLRNADDLTFAEIEHAIAKLGDKAINKKLTMADLEGGTFTISNGGVYGSMLSTPILNTPQCGILGMHAIQERAVVRDGEIVIRPMMYLALSYDHQLIDGREAVGFLKTIKEYIENPEELLLEL